MGKEATGLYILMVSFKDHAEGVGFVEMEFTLNEGCIYPTVEAATSELGPVSLPPTATDIHYYVASLRQDYEIEISHKVTKLSQYN